MCKVTDFPVPVAPATKRCGILERSEITGLPIIFFPIAKAKDGASLNSSNSKRLRSPSKVFFSLGIPIPTKGLPGIGASICILVAERAICKLSFKPKIFLTLTPWAGFKVN